MKIRDNNTGMFEAIENLKNKKGKSSRKQAKWIKKFYRDNGSIEDQIIEQAESPTTYKNKIKQWVKDNPKTI
ncbi:MAG: hypothetical protein KKB34_05145 [Bacteroidetes bacterium]|nr:hypothetical protein [Bacteroidota bacterium]